MEWLVVEAKSGTNPAVVEACEIGISGSKPRREKVRRLGKSMTTSTSVPGAVYDRQANNQAGGSIAQCISEGALGAVGASPRRQVLLLLGFMVGLRAASALSPPLQERRVWPKESEGDMRGEGKHDSCSSADQTAPRPRRIGGS